MYTHLDQSLHFFTVRAYDPDTISLYKNLRTYEAKFSVHVIVKHQTHMFPDRTSMLAFIDRLKAHRDWDHVTDIVDMSVYGKHQHLRVPCACKAPAFDGDTGVFDLKTPQNVLLPVTSDTGVQEWPMIRPGLPHITFPIKRWTDHLVCTPLNRDSVLPFSSTSLPDFFTVHDNVFKYVTNIVFVFSRFKYESEFACVEKPGIRTCTRGCWNEM
jgi:hypothetical protein